MNRRDLLLQAMNIPQWVLTKPQVLHGYAQISLHSHIKLVVVSEDDQQKSRLFEDVLRTLNLSSEEYQWLTFEQTMRLHFHHNPIFWLIQPQTAVKAFTKKYPNQTAWHNQAWQEISQVSNKRQLWQQMQPFCRHFEDNL